MSDIGSADNQKPYLFRSCPLCGAKELRSVISGKMWSITACRSCWNAWTEPPPPRIDYGRMNFHQEALAQSAQHKPFSLKDLPDQWQHSLSMQVDCLTNTLRPGDRVLEVGCGEGILLAELASRGLQVVGVEPSTAASTVARSKGLDVRTGLFPEVSVEGPIHAIVLSHVLEHLAEPGQMLDAIGGLLSGGYLLLVQTNWRGLMPRLLRGRWYAWVPEQHYWHFTPEGVAYLSRQRGWRVQAIAYSSLVHPHILRPIADIAARLPTLGDQFHILVRTGN